MAVTIEIPIKEGGALNFIMAKCHEDKRNCEQFLIDLWDKKAEEAYTTKENRVKKLFTHIVSDEVTLIINDNKNSSEKNGKSSPCS